MGWFWLVGSNKLYVSFAKEPYKRDNILQKRSIISSILLTMATPCCRNISYVNAFVCKYVYMCTCVVNRCSNMVDNDHVRVHDMGNIFIAYF